MQSISNITSEMWKIPNILRVNSISNFNHFWGEKGQINSGLFIAPEEDLKWTEDYLKEKSKAASKMPSIKNFLISKDQKSIAIYGVINTKGHQVLKRQKEIVKDIKKKIINIYQTEDLKIMVTGGSTISVAFEEESIGDLKLILPIAAIVLFLILLSYFKNFKITIISLSLMILTITSMMGIQGWLGIKLGLLTGMCPVIVLAICISDTIHIFSTYFKTGLAGETNPLRESLKKNLYPTFLTTVTTAIGFLSFLIADLNSIVEMGIIATIGVVLAWIYCLFILCPILIINPVHKNFSKVTSKKKDFFPLNPILGFITGNPKKIVMGTLLLSTVATFLSGQNVIDSNMQNYFAKSTDFRKSTDFFNSVIGGTNTLEVLIKNDSPMGIKDPVFLKRVDSLTNEIYELDTVTKVVSVVEQIKEVNKVLNDGKEEFYKVPDKQSEIAQELFFLEMSLPPENNLSHKISRDGKELRLTIFWNISSSVDITKNKNIIEKLFKTYNLDGHVTGGFTLIAGLDKYIIKSFIQSMILVIILICIFMSIVFNSLAFGLLSILPNLIVPSFGAALLYLMNRPFDVGSILIFSICMGVAIDDTIYFLTSFKQSLRKKMKIEDSIKYILNHSAKTLGFTTFILVTIFGLFYLGSFIPNKNFAIATSVILITALIVDLIFLPALLMIIEGSNNLRNIFRIEIITKHQMNLFFSYIKIGRAQVLSANKSLIHGLMRIVLNMKG
jgi:predicted RND superfamily exporter protein